MTPALMPQHRPHPTLLRWLLRHPNLVLAWDGDWLTLRVHNLETTIHAPSHPHIIRKIRNA